MSANPELVRAVWLYSPCTSRQPHSDLDTHLMASVVPLETPTWPHRIDIALGLGRSAPYLSWLGAGVAYVANLKLSGDCNPLYPGSWDEIQASCTLRVCRRKQKKGERLDRAHILSSILGTWERYTRGALFSLTVSLCLLGLEASRAPGDTVQGDTCSHSGLWAWRTSPRPGPAGLSR